MRPITVLDLQGKSSRACLTAPGRGGQQPDSLYALGATLGEHLSRHRAHQRGVEPASLTGDQLGVGHHRVSNPLKRRSQGGVVDRGRIGQSCKGEGQTAKRKAEGDHAATIGGGDDVGPRDVAQEGHGVERELLDRVVGLPVGLDRPAGGLGVQGHRGMLARAVVAKRRERLAIANQALGGLDVIRGMNATGQHVSRQAAPAEQRLHGSDVPVLAGVRGGHHRQCLDRTGEIVAVEASRGDEGRQLKWLGR